MPQALCCWVVLAWHRRVLSWGVGQRVPHPPQPLTSGDKEVAALSEGLYEVVSEGLYEVVSEVPAPPA